MRNHRWTSTNAAVGTLTAILIASCGSDQAASNTGSGGYAHDGGGADVSAGAAGKGGDSGVVDPMKDSDSDTISDGQEGGSMFDTDQDGKADFLDLDSDGDGIADAIEAGDSDLSTPPVDTDKDGTADFRDFDSDNDGIADGDEDKNHDGKVDPGETSATKADTDGDGMSDLIEQVAGSDPTDPADNPQSQGNFVFLVPYNKPPEPKDDDLRFRTNLRKVDLYFLSDISVSMDQELKTIHDNVVTMLADLTCDSGETPASCGADCLAGCGDADCGVGETAKNCPQDCLGNCGDGVCIGTETAVTCPKDCVASCGDKTCGGAETAATCPTDCKGTCGDGICHAGEQAAVTGCIEDIQSGAGVFGTASTSAACNGCTNCAAGKNGSFAYKNLIDIQADATATQTVLPDNCWGCSCWEPGLAATFFAVTGWGSATATAKGFTVPPVAVPEPPACPAGYRGYPCFRPDSLPIILLIGDEDFRQCYLPAGPAQGDCKTAISKAMAPLDFHEVSDAVNAMGAKVIGIQGSGGGQALTDDFTQLCKETGSLGANKQPLVYQGADANSGPAIAQGVRDLATGLPLDMRALMQDDTTDSVDAITSFVDYLDTYTPGTAECVSWPGQKDNEPDGHNDEYLDVKPGTPVCWMIHVKQNTTVKPTQSVQIFRAQVLLKGNGTIDLDARKVWFVVPPEISGGQVPK